ncbi:hypothetical protein Rsub_12199 [Raphidocelis subcapitata]|uniref:MD-2-related lipid-recognition domain-containing protein n=1 Tax=Raphidocelis subcapitata TaxID=307507 RepID=A0A2V0PIF4_9CHLO|nr:hypothetical protein Rsub_12199 [Raphidocelis subcapitata]|eukprot:GBF99574.1 hypothetical protein Rsub_12199 [Raphidocelis subcapitata]
MRPASSVAFVLAALLALACPRAARAFTWEACDADAAPFKASEVLLAPDPPRIGEQVTFTIKAAADRDVAAGAIGMSVAFMGTPIFEGSDDLCAKTACPIAPGPIQIDYVQDLPPIAPPGDYDVTLKARDAAGQELLCVVVHFSMVPPSLAAEGASGSGSGGGPRGSAPAAALAVLGVPEGRVAPSRRLLAL